MTGMETKARAATQKRQRVLVIDDDAVIRKFMDRVVSDAGYEIRTVGDGLSALDLLTAYHPHVIFLDMVLPDMDGRRLCRILRENHALKSAYIVIFSGILLEESPEVGALGADALLAKGPISQMADHVEEILRNPKGVRERCRRGEIIGTEHIYPRKMTTELLSNNRHFSLVLENMRQGILELSSDGRILFVNKAAASFFKKNGCGNSGGPIPFSDSKKRPSSLCQPHDPATCQDLFHPG